MPSPSSAARAVAHHVLLRVAGCVLLSAGCSSGPDGLAPTPAGAGPLVLIDWDARPLPEIPFPNDLATRYDPGSPTGLRLNMSLQGPTALEREVRAKVDTLTGFGIYSPLSVRFTAPLDLDEVLRRHARDLDPADDALFVIDVTEGSPTYLQPVELDIGHGRFPADVADPARYFPNDSRAAEPSILFDTVDEDADGDGVLDWGEDTDNDGLLDIPNVWPEGGDPRDDLLTWYDRQTDTLVFRPVVPMREETTYAVLLTSRLKGAGGDPVRSPWAWINHTSQTAALRPVLDALPDLGIDVAELAFAWTFTTGRVTGDLRDLRRGLYGEGPFAHLAAAYPARVERAAVMHEVPGEDNPYTLPAGHFAMVLSGLDLGSEEALAVMRKGYESASHVAGGVFTTPFLLADRDDGGLDTSDESWEVDAKTGTVFAEPAEVAFDCLVPLERGDYRQPFPVIVYGHGYGSSRIEAATLSWAAPRIGVAVCSFDYPGHGLGLPASEREEYEPIVTAFGLRPFLEHLLVDRDRDLDNDGEPDSGADQWTSDGFHTRDQVRQGALDMVQLVRALRQCGEGTMALDQSTGDSEATTCDWDRDGTPDIGGPDVDYFFVGGSLGGIITSVAASVEPHVTAAVPIVSGGGLVDISNRSDLGGATEAVSGRMWSPFVLGLPDAGTGELELVQFVNHGLRAMAQRTFARLPSIPALGKVVVENLDNGEVREGLIPADGRFRVGIPADALSGPEKRWLVGIPETGPEATATYTVPDNAGLGDRLRVGIFDADGGKVRLVDTFEEEVVFQAVTMSAGSPLVALSEGLGHIRSSADFRRLVFALALVTEPGDPISYVPHVLDPFPELFDRKLRYLQVNCVGDEVVMVNAGIAQARATGFLERHVIDPRYGKTVDDWLIDRRVIQGLEEHGPYTCSAGQACLFDPDDLDNGTDGRDAPSDEPLRVTIDTGDGGKIAFRMPYVEPTGSHSVGEPDPAAPFDWATFVINQVIYYLHTRGDPDPALLDDPCLATNDCPFLVE